MRFLKERKEFKSSLVELLKNVMDDVKEIEAAQITADTGQALASVLPPDVDDMRFAAITAALCSLSERAISEMGLGEMEQAYVKGNKGYVLVLHAGEDQILTVSTTNKVQLAPILFKHYKRFDDDEETLLSSEASL
ncbi:MAG: roadblock/LC7 domain-containing protein [Candidatus Lokiarchaeota archaeon]|jgi:predicted regulator of Ras-like GTPase activity (Roadblock/LC7/MglB family)